MTINLTKLEIKTPFATLSGSPYLKASVGLICVATIEYYCDFAHNSLDFFFELARTSQTIFSYKSNVEKSLTNKYSGSNASILSPVLPKGSHFGSAQHFDLGANNYRILHTFIITPFPTIENEIPNEYLSQETLKYQFKIDVRNGFNPTIVATLKNTDIGGQVGFLNEMFNGFTPVYSLASKTVINSFEEMQFEINSLETVTTATKIVLVCAKQVLNYDIQNNIVDNYGLKQIEILANNTNFTGLGFQYAKAQVLSASKIKIYLKFTTNNPFLDSAFFIWAVVGNVTNNEIDNKNNAVSLHYFSENASPAPFCGAKLAQHPDANFLGFAFFYHDSLTVPFSEVSASLQDDVICKFKLSVLAGYTLKSLRIVIQNAIGQIVETQTFTGNAIANKGYILENNSEFNKVNIDFTNLLFTYAFKIRYEDNLANETNDGSQNWASYTTNKLFFSAIATIGNGTNDYEYTLNSPVFNINNYNIDSGLIGVDPVVDDIEIQTFDNATNTNLNGGFSEGLTKVVVTCNANPANNLGFAQNDLTGILSIEDTFLGSVFSIRSMSNDRARETNTPFLPVLPAPDRLQVLSYTSNQIVWHALIDGSLISEKSCLSFRLDRIRTSNIVVATNDPCCFSTIEIVRIIDCDPDNSTDPITNCKAKGTFITSFYNTETKKTYNYYNDGSCGMIEIECCGDQCFSTLEIERTNNCQEKPEVIVPNLPTLIGCLDLFAPNYNPNANVAGTCINFLQSCGFIKYANGEVVYNGFQDTTGIRTFATDFSEYEISAPRIGYGNLNPIVEVAGVKQIVWRAGSTVATLATITPTNPVFVQNLASESKFLEVTIPRVNGREAKALSFVQTFADKTRGNFVSARVWVESYDVTNGFKIGWMTYNLTRSGLEGSQTTSINGTGRLIVRKNGTIVLNQVLTDFYGFSLNNFVYFNDISAGVYDLRVEFQVIVFGNTVTFYNDSNYILS